MATGALASGPLGVASGASSSTLSGAALAVVTTSSCMLVAGSSVGAKGAYTAPVMTSPAAAGRLAPWLDGQWFDRIHVLPREVAFGNITNDRSISVEVFNAWRRGFRLWDVAISGNSGIDMPGVSTPAEFGPLHSEVQTVLVSSLGSDDINNVISWQFRKRTDVATYVVLSTPGADLTLSGSRMLIFTARPEGGAGIRERIGQPTDVIVAWDRSEQRVQLREGVVRDQRFTGVLLSAADALDLSAKLYLSGAAPFAVPYWPDVAPVAAAVAGGATEVMVDTAGREFVAGGNALLWRDQRTWEAFSVLSVAADRLVVDGAIAGAFALEGTKVIPLLPMRLLDAPAVNRQAGQLAVTELAFSGEGA